MYRLLRLLFIGTWKLPIECQHKWKEVEKYSFENYYEKGVIKLLKCEHCGELKKFKVSTR